MTRILQFLLSPRIGGAETLAESLHEGFQARGHICQISYLDEHGHGKLSRIAHVRKTSDHFGPDIIISHSALPNIYTRLSMVDPPIITVLHSAANDFQKFRHRTLERLLARSASAVVAVSELRCTEYRRAVGTARRIIVIRNGVREIRPKNWYPDVPTRIVAIARVATQKDPQTWLNVAEHMLSEMPQLDFLWYGPADDEWLEPISGVQVPGISFMGPYVDLQDVLDNSDIMFHSAQTEGYSLALLEAASAGLPIVCSQDVAQTLPDTIDTISFKTGSVTDAVAALSEVIRDYKQVSAAASRSASTVSASHSTDSTVDSYMALIEQITTS